jgi:2,4-dienoyl-CoA reductase-like NADH-dependent reductase (Old Yellow Enzyme family)
MPVLFEPIKIGNIEMRNRFMRSATYYALADDKGFVGEASVALMKSLAVNDVGLIVTGYAYVQSNGQCFNDQNGIQDDDHISGYRKVTRAVHDSGGKIVMQIAHGGIGSRWIEQIGGDLVAVSMPEEESEKDPKPREMTDADIEGIIHAFGQAARRVQEAGFDGVQIHGAHGYLVTQFLSPYHNRRKDKWGGSLENRMRFVIETIREIKKRVDDDFPVMIKLRLTIEEGMDVAKALEKEGISHIEISHGSLDAANRRMSTGITEPGQQAYMLPDAQKIRESTSIALGLVGGMRSPSVMEQIIQAGTVDSISISRPLIREPDLISQWKKGSRKTADCISCGRCFNRKDRKMHIHCAQIKQTNKKEILNDA